MKRMMRKKRMTRKKSMMKKRIARKKRMMKKRMARKKRMTKKKNTMKEMGKRMEGKRAIGRRVRLGSDVVEARADWTGATSTSRVKPTVVLKK